MAAVAGSSSVLVDDFFSTIEEVGLSDIAKECGITLGARGEMDGAALGSLMGGDVHDGNGASMHADSQLCVEVNGVQRSPRSTRWAPGVPHC